MKLHIARTLTLWYFICINARASNDLAGCSPQCHKIQACICPIEFVPELLNDRVLQPMLVSSCERSWRRNKHISVFNAVRITTNFKERVRGNLRRVRSHKFSYNRLQTWIVLQLQINSAIELSFSDPIKERRIRPCTTAFARLWNSGAFKFSSWTVTHITKLIRR